MDLLHCSLIELAFLGPGRTQRGRGWLSGWARGYGAVRRVFGGAI